MKILRVGDPHVTVSNLSESIDLIDFVIKTGKNNNCETVEILGDLFDTHAVIRSEVLNFWKESLSKLSIAFKKVIVLMGNHDTVGDKSRENEIHALNVFKDCWNNVVIVDKPYTNNNILYLPYTSNEDTLVNWCKENTSCNLLVGHQTFIGAAFENGFYTEEGFDLDKIPQKEVISGHIHSTGTINKCFYPGAPRWLKTSDSGAEKGIWIFEHNEDGTVKSKQMVSTEGVVTKLVKMEMNESSDFSALDSILNINKLKISLELKGSLAWIGKIKTKYRDNNISIKGLPIERKSSKIEISQMLTIEDYINNFCKTVSPKEKIVSFIRGI